MNTMHNFDFIVIFDMDGVLVDNNKFHRKAWRQFCQNHDFELTNDQFKKHIFGKINADILCYLFYNKPTKEQIHVLSKEKEAMYREAFEGHVRPVKGLLRLLDALKENKIKMAIASSAPPSNINFVLDKIEAQEYFDVIVDDTQIVKGKPDPEIYIKAAEKCKAEPSKCIVFEDSISGIRSAKAARMKVVALTTTHSNDELREADLVIDDFTQITVEDLSMLLERGP